VWAYLREDTDVTLTCWTPDGQTIIDDPFWMKTTNNCYVAQKNLYEKPDIDYLDNCGPIPFLEILHHWNENGSSEVDKRGEVVVPPAAAIEKRADLGADYLVNVTVGEEYAYCRSCPDINCKVKKRYEFDQEVWLQCLAERNGTWWSETTDFCYVNNADFWQCPQCDCKFFLLVVPPSVVFWVFELTG